MRKGKAFKNGMEDGRVGKDPNPVRSKVSYMIGYGIGRSEWESEKLQRELSKRMSGQ